MYLGVVYFVINRGYIIYADTGLNTIFVHEKTLLRHIEQRPIDDVTVQKMRVDVIERVITNPVKRIIFYINRYRKKSLKEQCLSIGRVIKKIIKN